jgi:hypothetical protein
MLIGQDFEKISFDLFGYTFLEPNAFIGDVIIFIVAVYYAVRINKLSHHGAFCKNWYWFYVIFGTGFLIGGFSHLLYNSWGVSGKYLPWISGIISAFFLEQAMISIYPKKTTKNIYKKLSSYKLIFVLVAAVYTYATVDLSLDNKKGLMIPTANSVVGLGFGLIALGTYYYNKLDKNFRYFWISGLLLFPSAVFQALKINLHPWMDRNDVSHILLVLSLILYFKGIEGYSLRKEPINE